ncbi:hypothetical protein V6R21_11740 [Limibacter armeniacum]|uniref:hypothetical protein n=1 Tax=Limibacter armeniacum TaxID=466084 RepID=UPI002FE65AF4
MKIFKGNALRFRTRDSGEKLYVEEAQYDVLHAWYEQPWMQGKDVFIAAGFFPESETENFYAYLVDSDYTVLEGKALAAGVDYSLFTKGDYLTINEEGTVVITKDSYGIGATAVNWVAESEPITFSEPDLLEVTYYNDPIPSNPYSVMPYYFDNSANQFQSRVYIPARLVNADMGEETESYTDSKGNLLNVKTGTWNQLTLQTRPMPAWMHDKLQIAMMHNVFVIDGVQYVRQGSYSRKHEDDNYSLFTAEVELRVADSYLEIKY